jgi:hypothetical protein
MVRNLLLMGLLVAVAAPLDGQYGRRRSRGRGVARIEPNVGPVHEFTFVRLQYTPSYGPSRNPGWFHDYPTAERNFAKILEAVSLVEPYMGGSNILRLDDPELFKYPLAYLSEPGFWTMNEGEREGLRNYLLKGGFLIVDDFPDMAWQNFELQMRRALPELQPLPLQRDHPIFNSFFDIRDMEFPYSYRGYAQFFGYFEDNDPEKRLMVVVNYSTDVGEFWEYSDTGFIPIDLSNEAYKLGVNYLMYAMMH